MPDREPEKPEWVRDLGFFMVIMVELFVSTAIGIGGGYFLWAKLGWPWWILLLSSSLGLAFAMFRVYRITRK